MIKLLAHLFLFSLIFSGNALSQDGHDHGHGHSTDLMDSALEQAIAGSRKSGSQTKKTVIFSRYAAGFVDLCTGLARDGRRERFMSWIAELEGFQAGCGACRPLYKLLRQSCEKSIRLEKLKAAPKGTPVEGQEIEEVVVEPTPTPFPELDPHPEVIDTVSRIFAQMVEYTDEVPEAYKAIKKLLDAIKAASYAKNRERDYFMVIHEYIEAPFRPYLREVEEAARVKETPSHDAAADEFFTE